MIGGLFFCPIKTYQIYHPFFDLGFLIFIAGSLNTYGLVIFLSRFDDIFWNGIAGTDWFLKNYKPELILTGGIYYGQVMIVVDS